jgi:hypothetical protein
VIWIAKNGMVLVGRSEKDRMTMAPSIAERCYHCTQYRKCRNRFASDWYWCRKFERRLR